jgi:hypothetical protein
MSLVLPTPLDVLTVMMSRSINNPPLRFDAEMIEALEPVFKFPYDKSDLVRMGRMDGLGMDVIPSDVFEDYDFEEITAWIEQFNTLAVGLKVHVDVYIYSFWEGFDLVEADGPKQKMFMMSLEE